MKQLKAYRKSPIIHFITKRTPNPFRGLLAIKMRGRRCELIDDEVEESSIGEESYSTKRLESDDETLPPPNQYIPYSPDQCSESRGDESYEASFINDSSVSNDSEAIHMYRRMNREMSIDKGEGKNDDFVSNSRKESLEKDSFADINDQISKSSKSNNNDCIEIRENRICSCICCRNHDKNIIVVEKLKVKCKNCKVSKIGEVKSRNQNEKALSQNSKKHEDRITKSKHRTVPGRNGCKIRLKSHFSCDACDVRFDDALSLHQHLKSKEHINVIGINRVEVAWSCPFCVKYNKIENAHNYMRHMNSKGHKKEMKKRFGVVFEGK